MTNTRESRFESRSEFHELTLQALALANRSILLTDPTLSDWPLESAAGAQALRDALQRGARMRVLVSDTNWAERFAPRLTRLSREFAARVEFRRLPSLLRIVDSFLVVDGQHTVRRIHADSMKGVATFDAPRDANTPAHRFESAWPESEPCLPATTLGL